MPILNTPNQQPPGLANVYPAWIYIETNDTVATVTTTGYLTNALNFGWSFNNEQLALVLTTDSGVIQCQISVAAGNIVSLTVISISGNSVISVGSNGVAGELDIYPATLNKGHRKLVAADNAANYIITETNASFGQSTTLTIPDPNSASASYVLSSHNAGQTVAATTASATPGTIRALIGSITSTNASISSSNIVGLRGVATIVGAGASSFVYGVQGKVIISGTISSSAWVPAVFGQLDISAATLTGGSYISGLHADFGTTGPSGLQSALKGIVVTNTTASIAGAQLFLYGGATYLMDLEDNSGGVGATYITTATGATAGGTLQKLEINVNGTPLYILAAATWS